MIIEQVKWIYDQLVDQLIVSHLSERVECFIFDTDHVPAKVKNAIKEKYNAQFLKDASYVLWFWDKGAEAAKSDDDEENEEAAVEEGETIFDQQLKTRVIKSIMKVFHLSQKEEVETFDLELADKKYFFVKLSWK